MVAGRRSAVIWEDPPARERSGRGPQDVNHGKVAESLKANPHTWGRVGKYSSANSSASVASHIRRGLLTAYAPAGLFLAVARTVDGEHRVYAMYIGEEE